MRKVNTNQIADEGWSSPKGRFGSVSKAISVALGRQPFSTDMKERHPFDVEICRIPPGKSLCPDSGKWLVRSPERRLIRSEALDYFDGEE